MVRHIQSYCAVAVPHVVGFDDSSLIPGRFENGVKRLVEAEARGWAAAMSGEFRVESKTGRGERASASLTQQSLRFLMINRTPGESLPATTARSA
jgi:hypothetical protein